VRRLALLSAFLFLFLPKVVLAQETGWVIDSFNSEIFIPQDGKARVTETIQVDFSGLEKHGIYRDIPIEGIKFRILKVTQDETKAKTSISRSSGGVSIRIGDPDSTMSGEHVYVISYEVGKVITRFDANDEFYWDVTGSEWGVPITSASATVSLEGGQVQEVTCYTGQFGSSAQDCSAKIEDGVGEFQTTASLSPFEGLTVVNKVPKGLVADPIYWGDILKIAWAILGSLAAAGFVVQRWLRHGRDMWYRGHVIEDPKAQEGIKPIFAKQTVVVEFEPPKGLRPAEVGTLVDEKIDMQDVSGTIVDLAVRGYLKISEDKKRRKYTYTFEKLREFKGDASLSKYEVELLDGLFGTKDSVELSDLKNKFYKHLKPIKDELYKKLTGESYFVESPDKVRTRYFVFGGIALGLASFALPAFSISTFSNFLLFLPIAVLGVFLLVFASFMPKKTAKGTEAVRRAAGFKLFISTAQKYMQEFNESINRFDEFLPYAMVFGVVDKWVNTFEKLGIEPPQPTWYVGYTPFNARNFSSSMTRMGSVLASTLPSSPSQGGGSGFGGGGFSGGGFGGGGGGSW
jgi:uncharacterized membrane protein